MSDEHTEQPNDQSNERPAAQPGEDLETLVDDMEKNVEREREEQGVEGSVSDRHERAPIETGDDAPD